VELRLLRQPGRRRCGVLPVRQPQLVDHRHLPVVSGVYTGCDPAFYDIPAGYHWTVAIRITWTSRHTGGVIGRADYYPTPNASDIDCAYYAEYTVHRCVGPRASIPYNLFAPRNVGYLTLL
jgi:hypothetical protein